MDIAVLVYPRLTVLDAVGPYEVLSRIPGATVTFVAETKGAVRSDVGSLGLVADASLDELSGPDIVVVPGGPGQTDLMDDGPVHEWLRSAHETTTWTTSVCTGSLILAAAGILDGVRATSHWLAMDQLERYGAIPVSERVVEDGEVMTAAGVSSGIDMGLTLAARLVGPEIAQTIQLGIEYDPQPPFDAGSPGTAPDFAIEFLRSQSRFVLEGR
ncbi:MAG TPA: DJ-1/PfpI family protein [Acidimicrobiia bacterium]|nr:DJ-1/PfpI family protein [Acidimicrobiia bacterium]